VAHRSVQPGAEPFRRDAGRTGVLLCHGFTASPASLRPWAEALAASDLSVRLPLLPGHGTHWRDLALTRWPDWYLAVERELLDLAARCDRVFVMGLSMGGTLTLRLAQQHPDAVTGIVVVNPSLHRRRPEMRLVPYLRHVVPSVAGIGSDIKKGGQDEEAYSRTPLQALHSLTELWQDVASNLSLVTCPVLVLASDEDHVVDPSNAVDVVEGVAAADLTFVPLHDSYHVATLDNDGPLIVEQSLEFVRRLSPAAALTADEGAAEEGAVP
jgi:carboxylesterase